MTNLEYAEAAWARVVKWQDFARTLEAQVRPALADEARQMANRAADDYNRFVKLAQQDAAA